jgi:hypothetical protein
MAGPETGENALPRHAGFLRPLAGRRLFVFREKSESLNSVLQEMCPIF